MGTLYLVATPIGNLEDISPRAIRVLDEVRLIAAEDTRVTRKMLNHFNLHTPLTSYYEHNKLQKSHQILAALEPGMSLTAVPANLNDPENLLPADSPNDLGIYLPADDRMYVGTFTRREILETLAPERSPAWRSLDLAYLHRYLIDELIAKRAPGGTAPTVHCVKSGRATIELARAKNGIALICKPCTMADLRAVSEAGDLMPQKSTFFYPKLATGLVIHPLE